VDHILQQAAATVSSSSLTSIIRHDDICDTLTVDVDFHKPETK